MASRSEAQSTVPESIDPQATSVLQVAERLHAMGPDWVVFFREVLGVEGIVRSSFPRATYLSHFECSPHYARIREMLDDLRNRQRERPTSREAQRVVTVRMPRSLHESLKAEADDMRVSINTLCISKLLKILDDDDRKDLAPDRGTPEEMAG